MWRMSRGTASSGAPKLRAAASSCSRLSAGALVNSTSASPLAASLRVEAACTAPGAALAAICSTTSSETISPASLAKRLRRPRMCRKPSASNSTMSPVAYQPGLLAGGGWMMPGWSNSR
ncbi:hypothetical protein D3C86_1595350 [compost metagenome]